MMSMVKLWKTWEIELMSYLWATKRLFEMAIKAKSHSTKKMFENDLVATHKSKVT